MAVTKQEAKELLEDVHSNLTTDLAEAEALIAELNQQERTSERQDLLHIFCNTRQRLVDAAAEVSRFIAML
jgi:hypothetical protein